MTEESKGLSSPHHPSTDASHLATDVTNMFPMERAVVYISLPICILGLLGNGRLAYMLNRITKTKFITKFTVYLFHLTAADLIILIYHVILFVYFIKATSASPRHLLKLEMMHEIGFCISLYLLTAISTERYLSLFFPLFYNRVRPLNFTTFSCITLWGLAALMSLVLHIFCSVKSDATYLRCQSARIFYVVVNFAIFVPLMVFTTVGLFIRMKNLPEEAPEVRLDITIVTTVLLFLILAASVKIVEILPPWIATLDVPKFFAFLPLIDSIQSSSKPFLYIFIGYSKDLEGPECFQMFLERAVMDERYIADMVQT